MIVWMGAAKRETLLGRGIARAAVAVSYAAFVLVRLTLSSTTLVERQHAASTAGLGAPAPLR